jgi:hypothetical protein
MRSKIRRMSSRPRKATVIMVVAPSSLPPVPIATMWDAIRFSSMRRTRIWLARAGTWSVIPSSFSTPRQ